jgi:hypothetical protein
MAITAVAAVRAGPEISRQSNRIPVLVPTENFFSFSGESNPCSVTIGCVSGRYSRFNPKKRFSEAARLSDLLYQNYSKADGTGFRAFSVSARFERISMPSISPSLLPILMLFASNVFMTFAWYGHLKFKESPLPLVIMVSWGIAFFEYWLAVPANRWGSAVYSAAQLKTMQEVITLIVFAGFSVLYLKEPLGWNHALGFALIAVGAFFIFHKWS